jgi:hypothetical protein
LRSVITPPQELVILASILVANDSQKQLFEKAGIAEDREPKERPPMDCAMRPDPAAACDLRELDYGEHLLVWSFRAIAAGRWDCDLIRREYRQACGDSAERARRALHAFAREAAQKARRPIALGRPGILGVTRDEQQLLAAYGAAQAGARARFEAHLAWLIGRAVDPVFYPLARLTASALAERGHGLGAATRAAVRAPPPEPGFPNPRPARRSEST